MLIGITVVFAVAWAATLLLYRASAALRHIVWTCAFVAVMLLAPLRWRAPQRVIRPALPAIAAIAATPAVTGAAAPRRARVDPSEILTGLWALGAIVLMLRMARNAMRSRALVRSGQGSRPILVSSGIKGPLVAGFWRPVVLLPEGAEAWTVSRRRAVLAHEAAHIRRHDPLILLAAQLTTALYWFHPLCWLAAARLRAESERACDDAAIRLGLRPSGYAGHLLALACRFDTQLAIPMATTSHLEARVKSILDPMTNRRAPSARAWLTVIALTIAVLAPLATLTVHAQQSTGAATITGIVTDPTGARIANARVIAKNADTGDERTAVTNAVGSYVFNNIAGGYYTIEVLVPGFNAFRLENQAVVNGGALQANAHLVVGSLSERVTVSARGTPKSQEAPGAGSGPVKVGGNVQAARILQQVSPVYPDDLQAQGIEGTVLLAAIISKDGTPKSLQVVKNPGYEEFVTAAMNAVEQWRYQPTLLNGEPTEVMTTIQVDFKLSAQAPYINDAIRPARVPRIDDRLIQ